MEGTLFVATSAVFGESDHQFWAWLHKRLAWALHPSGHSK